MSHDTPSPILCPPTLTLDQVATLAGCSRHTVRVAARAGTLRAHKSGHRSVRVNTADAEVWVADYRRRANARALARGYVCARDVAKDAGQNVQTVRAAIRAGKLAAIRDECLGGYLVAPSAARVYVAAVQAERAAKAERAANAQA